MTEGSVLRLVRQRVQQLEAIDDSGPHEILADALLVAARPRSAHLATHERDTARVLALQNLQDAGCALGVEIPQQARHGAPFETAVKVCFCHFRVR